MINNKDNDNDNKDNNKNANKNIVGKNADITLALFGLIFVALLIMMHGYLAMALPLTIVFAVSNIAGIIIAIKKSPKIYLTAICFILNSVLTLLIFSFFSGMGDSAGPVIPIIVVLENVLSCAVVAIVMGIYNVSSGKSLKT